MSTTSAETIEPVPGATGLLHPLVWLIDAGGPVVVVLLVMSVVALTLVFLKGMQFATLRLGTRRYVDQALEAWGAGRSTEALGIVRRTAHPIGRVMEAAIEGLSRPGVREDLVREEAQRVGATELAKLRTHFRALEIVGTLSPLLGLLGTVLGMIEVFRRLESAGSRVDPSILSGGIWEALLTTAVGLVVAIPAVATLHGFERVVDRVHRAMEDAVTRVFTIELATAPPELTAAPIRRREPRAVAGQG